MEPEEYFRCACGKLFVDGPMGLILTKKGELDPSCPFCGRSLKIPKLTAEEVFRKSPSYENSLTEKKGKSTP